MTDYEFITCNLNQDCERAITLKSYGSLPFECIKVKDGSLQITDRTGISSFAAIPYIDSNIGIIHIFCNDAGSGLIKIQYMSLYDSFNQENDLKIVC